MGQDRNHSAIVAPVGAVSSPLGLYIHIPFCEKKCFYCDFYSIENHSQRNEFVAALIKEISLASISGRRQMVDTIFLGGGTPSLLTPTEVETIIDAIHRHFEVTANLEFTIECNPGTVDTKYLSDYRGLGINRISFGVQSFFDDELAFLSRIHNSQEAISAVEEARGAGFDNINIDLMYALPSQTTARLLSNLETGMKLRPTHLSAYALIVEPGTPLFAAVSKGDIKPSEDDTEAAMYETVMNFMAGKGYDHYEISNYSLPGFQCRHNLKYWDVGNYIGFGPSAHSHLDDQRWWNISSLNGYLARLGNNELPISSTEILSPSQKHDEFIFLNLRQGKLDLRVLRARFGMTLERDFLSGMMEAGYCTTADDTLKLTAKGFTVCDEIAGEIIGLRSVSV